MSWVQIDDNFPNHPKVLQAGPVAAWLFICGLCYCRKYLTGGFIPTHAVKTLGAQPKAITALVEARLWEGDRGGYWIHGYSAFYQDDADKQTSEERRRQKREAGRKGGLAAQARLKQNQAGATKSGQAETEQPATPTARAQRNGKGSDPVVVAISLEGGAGETAPAFHADQALLDLQEAYPQNRVTYGWQTTTAFIDELGGDPPATFVVMMRHLENHKRSHEWRVKGMAPSLQRWLAEGLWKRTMDEDPPVGDQLSPKTSRTLAAAASILGGKS
jgi:hypothetical protein